jgi:hypothetical protein
MLQYTMLRSMHDPVSSYGQFGRSLQFAMDEHAEAWFDSVRITSDKQSVYFC